MHTGPVKATPAAPPSENWRRGTVWLPCVLAFLWSVLLMVADEFAILMGSWDTAQPGLGWLTVAKIGHGLLAAASLILLVTGLSFPSWRRAAAITAWLIIPVGLGWVLLLRLVGS